jgi:hypothetical protein
MKIKKKELIRYINDWAERSEEQAYNWSDDGYFDEAFKAKVIAEFLKEHLVKGIEKDLIYEGE